MTYLRPNAFERVVFNRAALRFAIGGARPLEVAGRRSGAARRVPVIPIEHDGARYLVSTRGEAHWVRNLRAAGEARLGDETVRATEVPTEARRPIIAAYRPVAGKTVERYFKELPAPEDHPVFRLEPAA
jgi:deazaflavin-dependent oxidoreductase (nitroreductase family)